MSPEEPKPAAKQPTVKPTPSFKKGETVIHKDTRRELKVLDVVNGNLKCRGMVGLLAPTAVEKT